MCDLYLLDQINDLKEVETYCGLTYNNIGKSHSFAATVSNDSFQINQCSEKVFSSIKIKNVYMNIAQRYVQIHHSRFGCSTHSFVAMLGCMIHHLVKLLEENLCKRNIVQGIQESFEILGHLYRKSGIHVDKDLSFTMEEHTGEYLLGKINKYISSHFQKNKEELAAESYTASLKLITERLCHYKGTNMKEVLWNLVQDFLMIPDSSESSLSQTLTDESINPIKSIGALLNQTLYSSDVTEMSAKINKFKESRKNITSLVCTQPYGESGKEFSITSGVLVTILPVTAEVLNKFVGLRNCLMFDCNIKEVEDQKLGQSTVLSYFTSMRSCNSELNWRSVIIEKIKIAQVNCIILSGMCDQSLKDELQLNMDISVIENVSRRSLEIIASIMDVEVYSNIDTTFAVCQLLIYVLDMTTLDYLILCSIQVPKWMEIFGVTYVNLKTVLIRHPSIGIAKALFESFQHNLRRIENTLSMGFYLQGGGALEDTFAKELKARANDTIINNTDSEPIEQKCRTMLEVTKGLQLYTFYLHNNISKIEIDGNDDVDEKYDDLESKIGCTEMMSQCLTALFSTDTFIYCNVEESNSSS